jgi:hypothetical protein
MPLPNPPATRYDFAPVEMLKTIKRHNEKRG